ncbi:hypothetical protein ACHAWT_007212 [Skeletonema menzelii]
MASQHIRVCLFLIELSAAIGISVLTLVLLKVLHCGSWSVRISSTFALLWIIKAVANFFSSESQNDIGKSEDDPVNSNYHDVLKSFEAREQQESIHFNEQTRDTGGSNSPPKQSAMMIETREFLEEEAEGRDDAKITFSLIAILATVFLQLAIRLLVIAQNFTLTFRRRRSLAAEGNGLKKLLNIPFTIGRSLSPSGCSFYIFSFLNNFLSGEVFDAEDNDDDMALKALSFDHISTNSSSIWIRPLRKHSATMCQRSWLGLCFGDIELSLTLVLKRKRNNIVSDTNPSIRSVTIRMKINSFAVGSFPRIFDWVECSGVTIDASAAIDSNKTTGSKSFGLCLQSKQLYMYQVASTLRKIVAWDKIDVSCEANNRITTVGVLSIPSGFAAVGKSVETNLDRKVSVSKKAIVHLGSSVGNRIAVGINLKELPSFVQTLEILMKNIMSCVDKSNLNSLKMDNATTSKPKSPTHVVEICVKSNIHAYTIMSSSNILIGGRDVLSFRVACASVVFRQEADLCTSNNRTDNINGQGNDELLCCGIGAVMLRYEVTDDSAPALDLVSMKHVTTTLKHAFDNSERVSSQLAIIAGVSRMVVRVDANDVTELSSCMKIVNEIKCASVSLRNELRHFKPVLSSNIKQNAEVKAATRKRKDLKCIEILVDDVDAVFEINAGCVREGSVIANDDRVRFAVLKRKATVNISRQHRLRAPESFECDSIDAHPRKLFGSSLYTYGASFLIEVVASHVEASVTYSPHISLPVFDSNQSHRPKEVSFYAQASTFGLQTIIPSKIARSDATTLLTKAMLMTFNDVSLFERALSGNDTMPLITTSVHEIFFIPNETSWAMLNCYNQISPLRLTKIVQGTGEFCLTESRVRKNNKFEKEETISVRLRKGSSDVEATWSPVFQWIQMSFNKRLQAALAHLQRSVVGSAKGSSIIPSRHNTRVHVGVDSDVRAKVKIFVGVKSTALLIIDGGFDVNVSITKYPSVHRPLQLKPSICLHAGHIEAFLNGNQSPILITDGFVFQNTIRRALKHEIDEYVRKRVTPPTTEDICNEVVTDIDGHPLKEIFHLNIGTCATAKLPPTLFLGDVIDDFNLLPKSLDIGMNSLKENGDLQLRVRRYQLLTIECIIPSLSIALLDVDLDADDLRLRDEVSLFIEAGKLSIERNTPPELTQQRINEIDEDPNPNSYGPVVQGGDMQLSISHLMFNVHPLNITAPMVRIGNFSINGCLYLTGLSPTTPGIKESIEVKSMLLCHHQGNCCCSYGVSVDASGIPVKVYTDSIIHCDELDVNYGPVMGPSMPRLQECFKRILPPPKDVGVQEPLTWWDNIRFAVHGPITLCVDKLSFRWLLDSHIFQDQSIFLTCIDCTLGYKESFSLDAIDIDVSMPGVPYDTSVHPSESFKAPDFCLPHKIESMVGKGRHPLLFVPRLSTKMSFSWKMLNPGKQPYQHHSIYLDCKDEDTSHSDKFAFFRSDGFDVDLCFELPGGSDVVCNWIALRIDVLPWFTHLNSTVDYSSLHDDERQDPLPKFLSLGVSLNINRLKIAAWYEEQEGVNSMADDDFGGLCLIVRQVEYKAAVDDTKEINLGGPVKAALLNVRGFTLPDKNDESGSMSEMDAIEVVADEFGSSWKTELCFNNGPQSLLEENVSSGGTSTPFWKLEQLSCDISELDYVVTTGRIDICNQALAKILAGSDKESMSKEEEPMYADLDRTTWSILVSQLKILWTLEIRDCIMAISKDLIFVIGYMKSQIRQMHTLADRGNTSADGQNLSTTPMNLNESFDFSNSIQENSGEGLQYLLRRDSSRGMFSDISGTQGNEEPSQHFEAEEARNSTLPTLDIHFSNPQVQLHSKGTGGSVILAMEGAHVEGRKFVKFLVTNSHTGQLSPADLIRKTEHIYTLTNMEAYSLNSHVDIGVGLPWLEVDVPATVEPALPEPSSQLGVLFGISSPRQVKESLSKQASSNSLHGENKSAADDYEWKYPPELRHHEPFAFREQKNIRPILKKFTCLSRQLFHRPPIHYSNEELKSFIAQGLVIEQCGSVADDIDLEIDLLQFNLDSYQFKTTIDLIRNVLLKPPKPHRRSQNMTQLDEGTESRANRISSLAVFEMESALWAARARRASGKKERAALRSPAMKLIEDLERRIELYGDQMIRRITYKLSKLVWCVQSQGQIDDVRIAFTGFQGEHSYMASGLLKSEFGLEDLRVSSSTPGFDSMGFADPTSVLKPVLGSKRSPCQRCGSAFSHSNNGLDACRFHWGRFRGDKWTCCEAAASNAPGCKTAPHTGKERTAVVRVEALPPVVEGISLYSHLEVNIFPSVPHTLSVQISKSISRLFMDYFFIGQDDDDDDDSQSVSTDVTSSTDTTTSVRSDSTPKQTARKKSLLIGAKGIGISSQPIKEEISQSDSYDQEDQKQLRLGGQQQQQQQQFNETFLIKVLRVGYVNVEVSLGGFRALPQTTLNICVRDYTKAYKIGSPAYLGQKYLYYLIHEVLKSGASSALRRKKMTTSEVSDENEEDDVQAERKLIPAVSPSWGSRRSTAEASVGVEDIIGSPVRKSTKKKKRRLFS